METTYNRTGLDTLEDIMYETDLSVSQAGFRMNRFDLDILTNAAAAKFLLEIGHKMTFCK